MQWNGLNKWEDYNNDNYIDYVDNGPYVDDPILQGSQLLGRMVLREAVLGENGYWWKELALVFYHVTLLPTGWKVIGDSPDSGYEDKREGAEMDEAGEPIHVDGTEVDLNSNPPDFFKLNIMDYWLGKGTGAGDQNAGDPLKPDNMPGADLKPSDEPHVSEWDISVADPTQPPEP